MAYTASIGDTLYRADNEGAILITISDDLSVMIPASVAAPALYVDLPLNRIEGVTVESVESHPQTRS